ncbi:major capsid protein [Priestia megaterium]|uniref:major capsid protein n=1 Tax=Priestia megaterium TaxID=1404 RepID=UPI0020400EA7|nr:major capsid protein [Priestia megaterium]MCM3155600.1 major capsid protein [Priestia megaterium]
MINMLNNPILSEKTMLGFAKEKEQGDLFATQLLPERSVKSRAIEWKVIKNTRELAPEIREGSEDTLTGLGYDEKSAIVKEIREGAMLTEQAIAEASLRDLVKDHLDHLVERNILKQEAMIFNEIVKNAGSVYGQTVDWSSDTSSPLSDLQTVIRDAKKNDYVSFDTMVIDPDREFELLQNKEIREILLQAKPETLISGTNVKALGRIKGLNVYVADAVYDATTGEAKPILEGKTILMKKGSQTGNTMVREAMTVRRFADLGKRAIRLQVFKTMFPVIYRPQNIAIINHA